MRAIVQATTMIIESSFTYEGKNVSVRYEDADSFDHLPLEKVTQAYTVCFLGDDMVIVKNGKKNTWGLVGGSVEKGETLEACLAREVEEESNMRVLSSRPIGYQTIETKEKTEIQVRYVCVVEKIDEFLSDPAGKIIEVRAINPVTYKEYFDWGKVGERIVERAQELRGTHA